MKIQTVALWTTFLTLQMSPSFSLGEEVDAAIERLPATDRAAISVLKKLGASVDAIRIARTKKTADDVKNERPSIIVIIDEKWTGNDSDLKQVPELSTLAHFYVIGKGKVSDEALNSLRKARPLASVQRRSKATLGITGEPGTKGIEIRRVASGSPAADAGFRRNDILVKFAGKSVASFDDLLELMVPMEPGQKVEVELLRGGETTSMSVELAGWKNRQ